MINRHPLDPLSLEEVQESCDLLKIEKDLNEHFRFVTVMTHEPLQSEVLKFKEGDAFNRLAFLCVFDSRNNETFEAVVDLTHKKVQDWQKVPLDKSPYGQPPILLDEIKKCDRIVKADQAWRQAMTKRGLTNEQIDLIQVDAFSAGNFGFEKEKGKRLVRAVCYYRDDIKDNGYARPIEGVVAVVDLAGEGSVLELVDDGKNTPIPTTNINYDSDSYPDKRSGIKPLVITQPDGPSFTVNGNHVRWGNTQFRVGFTDREGVVLHQISYQDKDRERPIVYRASVTDMLVPYADPSVSHYWKSAFDAGEYGLGKFANQLQLGCDCLGYIHYFNVPVADDFGKAFLMKNAICMHEEDAGIEWKHNESRNGISETRRRRELVISFFTTIGNYDYGFYWRLGQDTSIKLEIKLTGIVQTAAVFPGAEYKWGGKLTPELAAPTHQHFFNVRLHMMVDGENNSISENEYYSLPMNEENPYGTAFGVRQRQLVNESEAVRDVDASVGRSWKIYNNSFLNDISQPTAYKLEVPHTTLLLSHPESSIAKRGAYATHHLWVTPYDAKQKYATGDYPNQSTGGAGLPSYMKDNRDLSNKALVVWVTAGVTHVVNPEEFPVMPASTLSLKLLRPYGFFNRNPTMDLPVDYNKKSSAEKNCCHADNIATNVTAEIVSPRLR